MPLGGPRPNPNPSNIPPSGRVADSSYTPPPPSDHPANSDSSFWQRPPPFPSSPPSSQLPYPHQSSPESGTTRLEPEPAYASRDDGLSGARGVQNDWSSRGPEGMGGDLGMGHGFQDPYEDHPLHDAPSRMGGNQSEPSIGPWDSASQRSLGQHPVQPSHHIPLSSSDANGYGQHVRQKPSYAGGLSYIDEEGAYYKSDSTRPASALMGDDDYERRGLVYDAEDPAGRYRGSGVKLQEFEESPYPYPPSQKSGERAGAGMPMRGPNMMYDLLLFPTGLDRLLALFGVRNGQYPVEQAIERKKRGLGGQRWPVAAWGLAVVMTALMVYELVRNNAAQGTPIAIHPSFNYMIGPSAEVLINIGARFPPCMKDVTDIPATFALACLNDTSNPPTTSCTVEEICGHGGFDGATPDQSWRFVLPIFLHVGILHLLLNMIAQITAGAQVEREMGTIPFLIVYMAGGIYGFVLGGNFSRPGVPSVGASGALFATNACVAVDLALHWKYEERPKLKAFLLFIEFAVGFAIGYIPNAVDGLAHLGGWAMGLLFGIILYPSISETRRHRYIVWGARVVAVPLIILAFVLTIRNFYTADPNSACEWCKFLSCIPTSSNNRCTGTGLTQTTTTNTRRSWDLL